MSNAISPTITHAIGADLIVPLARQVLALKIIAAFVTLGFVMFLARTTSAVTFGQVAFILNFALLLSVVGSIGQQMAMLRFVPMLRGSTHLEQLITLRTRSFRLVLLGTVTIATLGAAGLYTVGRWGWVVPLPFATLVLGCALIPVIGWIDTAAHLARGLGHIRLSLLPKDILWRLCSAATILATQVIYGTDWQPTTLSVAAILFATLVTLSVGLHITIRSIQPPPDPSPSASAGEVHDAWRSSVVPFWISSVSNIFLANADVICVALVVGPVPAGYYFAANRLAQFLAFFQGSYNIVIGPQIAQDWARGAHKQVGDAVRQAALKSGLATLGAGVILWLLAPIILGLFGPEFSEAAGILRVMILAAVINAALGPSDIVLNMCGHERKAMWINALSIAIGAALLVFGAMFAGALGAACAVLAGTILRKLAFWAAAITTLNIRCDMMARPVFPAATPR